MDGWLQECTGVEEFKKYKIRCQKSNKWDEVMEDDSKVNSG